MPICELVSIAKALAKVVADGKISAEKNVQLWNSACMDIDTLRTELALYGDTEAVKKLNEKLTIEIQVLQCAAAVSLCREESKDIQLRRYAIAGRGAPSLECEEDCEDDEEIERLSAPAPTLAAVSFLVGKGKGKRGSSGVRPATPHHGFTTPPRVVRISAAVDNVRRVRRQLECGLKNTAPGSTFVPLPYDDESTECPDCGGSVCMCDSIHPCKRMKQEPN